MTVKDFLQTLTTDTWDNSYVFVQCPTCPDLLLAEIEHEDFYERPILSEEFLNQTITKISFESDTEEQIQDITVYTK